MLAKDLHNPGEETHKEPKNPKNPKPCPRSKHMNNSQPQQHNESRIYITEVKYHDVNIKTYANSQNTKHLHQKFNFEQTVVTSQILRVEFHGLCVGRAKSITNACIYTCITVCF